MPTGHNRGRCNPLHKSNIQNADCVPDEMGLTLSRYLRNRWTKPDEIGARKNAVPNRACWRPAWTPIRWAVCSTTRQARTRGERATRKRCPDRWLALSRRFRARWPQTLAADRRRHNRPNTPFGRRTRTWNC